MNVRLTLLACAVFAVSCNCGPKLTPPDPIERSLPPMGDPEHRDASAYVYEDDAGLPFADAGPCCNVRFAFNAHGNEEGAIMYGSALDLPVELTRNGDVWEATACVYPQDMTYYALASVAGDLPDSGFIEVPLYNQNAPTTASVDYGIINRFVSAGVAMCSTFDGGVYGDTTLRIFDAGSEPDGGLQNDAGADAGGTDAGTPDSGTDAGPASDGGLPVKTIIVGACDTLTSATVLLSATNGTPVLDDNFTSTTALPFALTYFGTPVTHYAMNMNGYAMLFTSATGATAATDNMAIPDTTPPNGVVAPFWDDMVSSTTGVTSLRTQLFGSGNTRHLTLEWQNLGFLFGAGDERVTFQTKLFEGSNAIEFHYCNLVADGGMTTFEQGFGATVGIENLTGTAGVQHSNNAAVLSPATAVRFE